MRFQSQDKDDLHKKAALRKNSAMLGTDRVRGDDNQPEPTSLTYETEFVLFLAVLENFVLPMG